MRLFFGWCTVCLFADDFTIFGVVGFVGCFASVLLLRWMRTAILAGGDCGRPLWLSLGVLVSQRW